MVDILKMLVELDNAEITGILLMILFFVYIVVIYTYKILRLNKRSNLEELQIKRDIIENKEEKTNDLELIDEIIDFDVSNEHIDNKFNIEDKFIYKLLKLHHEQALKQ